MALAADRALRRGKSQSAKIGNEGLVNLRMAEREGGAECGEMETGALRMRGMFGIDRDHRAIAQYLPP